MWIHKLYLQAQNAISKLKEEKQISIQETKFLQENFVISYTILFFLELIIIIFFLCYITTRMSFIVAYDITWEDIWKTDYNFESVRLLKSNCHNIVLSVNILRYLHELTCQVFGFRLGVTTLVYEL